MGWWRGLRSSGISNWKIAGYGFVEMGSSEQANEAVAPLKGRGTMAIAYGSYVTAYLLSSS
jgi:hypothetical protein